MPPKSRVMFDFFSRLPSENKFDIFSRLPVKALARCRCVSKQWCNHINDPFLEIMHAKLAANDPVPIMFHQIPIDEHPNSPCTLSFLEYKEEADTCTLEVRKNPPVMDFMCNTWNYRNPDDIVLGSCNGLVYSQQRHRDGTSLVVINPLRKDCYELPPITTVPFIDLQESNRVCVRELSGLGFDDSTNTFKMVCVVQKEQDEPPNDLHQDLCTMVHVLGTDHSWRKIHQVPSFPITGEGVFANGCLHWLISDIYDEYRSADLGRPVISFDMVKEEFGLIDPPHELPSGWVQEQLVGLHGEVGYVYNIVNRKIEVWVLKERGWVMHCEFEQKAPLPSGVIKVLGFWNDNGDVLMTDDWKKRLFVYNLKGESLHEVSLVGLEGGLALRDIRMYQSSLFSTRYSIKN